MPEADRCRRDGQAEDDSAPPGGRSRLLDRRLDGRPEIVRSQVEQDEPGVELGQLEQVLGEPVEALELHPAAVQELRPGGRVVGGSLGQELVEREQGRDRGTQLMRHVGEEVAAAIPIPADHLDARLELVGHGVELHREGRQLGRPGADVGARDSAGQVARREGARRLGQAAQRRRHPEGHRRGNKDRDPEGQGADGRRHCGDVVDRRLTERPGVREADLDDVGVPAVLGWAQERLGREGLLLQARPTWFVGSRAERPVRRGDDADQVSLANRGQTEGVINVCLRELIGDERRPIF